MPLPRLFAIGVLAGLGTAVRLVAAPHSAGLSEQQLGKLPLAVERQGTAANERYIARGRAYRIALENNAKATLGLWSGRGDALASLSIAFKNARRSSPRPGRTKELLVP